jgi:hypothetical protein
MDKIQTLTSLPEAEMKTPILYLRESGAEISLAARNLFVNLHKYDVTSSNIETFLKRKQEVPEKETNHNAYLTSFNKMPRRARTISRCIQPRES